MSSIGTHTAVIDFMLLLCTANTIALFTEILKGVVSLVFDIPHCLIVIRQMRRKQLRELIMHGLQPYSNQWMLVENFAPIHRYSPT